MTKLNGLRSEIERLLAGATRVPRPDRIRAICETVEALQLDRVFAAWMNARFGDPALEQLSDADLDEVFAYVRSMAGPVGGGPEVLPWSQSG